MLIAIDHGNYAVKTPDSSLYPAYQNTLSNRLWQMRVLEYEGRFWTLSGRRFSYMRDKTQDDRYFVLDAFCHCKRAGTPGRYSPVEQIQLAVGLPPEHYGVLERKIRSVF